MSDKSSSNQTSCQEETQTTDCPSDDWSIVGPERAWYRRGKYFIKRSLRPSEYITTLRGNVHVPRLGKERLQNEAASMQFIGRVSNIPVPQIYGAFEVDDSFFIIMEFIEGVPLAKIPEDRKHVVHAEIQQHVATLQTITSTTLGGPSGVIIPPYRVMHEMGRIRDDWALRAGDEEYAFCHNDLSTSNILVDPETLKIQAIIDWEYAGFYPAYFEGQFWRRPGPSVALEGEEDDVQRLVRFLESKAE